MSGIDNRRKGMDAKLEHDSELQFKINNRRNKLLGAWAAEQLGLSGDEAQAYAKTVVLSDFEEPGDDDVLRKVVADFEAKPVAVDAAAVRKKMEELHAVAQEQVFDEKG